MIILNKSPSAGQVIELNASDFSSLRRDLYKFKHSVLILTGLHVVQGRTLISLVLQFNFDQPRNAYAEKSLRSLYCVQYKSFYVIRAKIRVYLCNTHSKVVDGSLLDAVTYLCHGRITTENVL